MMFVSLVTTDASGSILDWCFSVNGDLAYAQQNYNVSERLHNAAFLPRTNVPIEAIDVMGPNDKASRRFVQGDLNLRPPKID